MAYRQICLFLIVFVCQSSLCLASCLGPSSSEALANFHKNPLNLVKSRAPDIGAQFAAVAAAAINARDPEFGPHLASALGIASADQGREIGSALGLVVASCSDLSDPADRADKLYVSTNLAPFMLTNVAANAAYGEALEGGQSAATGGGGGGEGVAGGDSGNGGQIGGLSASDQAGNFLPLNTTSSGTANIPPSGTFAGSTGIATGTAGIFPASPITSSTVLRGARPVSAH